MSATRGARTILATCLALAAARAATAAAPDLSWMVDEEIPAHISAAQREAATEDAAAADALRRKKEVLDRSALAEKERRTLEAELPATSRSRRAEIEARVRELSSQIEKAVVRVAELNAEGQARKEAASAHRLLAARAALERRTRDVEKAAGALAPEIELATVSDARLGTAQTYHQRRLKRVPVQLAALDTELDQIVGALERAAVVARKDRVRASAAEDQRVIAAIQQELSFREGSKHDDAEIARQLEEVGRHRESERAAERVTDTSSSVAKDRFLDSVLAKQDRELEAREHRSRFRRLAFRVTVTLAGLGGIIAMVVIVLRRSS